MNDFILSVMMLVAFALIAGAIVLLRRGGPKKQPVLMLVLAAIMVANAAIWAIPTRSGDAPASAGVPEG